MRYDILTDSSQTLLYGIQVFGDDGRESMYTTLDVAYTIAQSYRDVLTGDTSYISRTFPPNCLNFQLDESDTDVLDTMKKLEVGFYFNTEGEFIFSGEDDLNAKRAAEEFIMYLRAGYLITAPTYKILDVVADEIIVKRGFGKSSRIYVFHE